MTDYTKLGTEIGDLVTKKNEAYGSSFARAGDFLRLLWPNGVPAGREDDALLLVRIFDKQMRIATDRDAFGESPYRDIAGYGLLGAALHEDESKRKEAPCGSASADAEDEPKARPDSQPQSAAAATTTNAAASRPPSSSGGCFPKPVFSSLNAVLQDAFAPTATVNAASGEEGRRSVLSKEARASIIRSAVNRSRDGLCAYCAMDLFEGAGRNLNVDGNSVTVHYFSCTDPFHKWAASLGFEVSLP